MHAHRPEQARCANCHETRRPGHASLHRLARLALASGGHLLRHIFAEVGCGGLADHVAAQLCLDHLGGHLLCALLDTLVLGLDLLAERILVRDGLGFHLDRLLLVLVGDVDRLGARVDVELVDQVVVVLLETREDQDLNDHDEENRDNKICR